MKDLIDVRATFHVTDLDSMIWYRKIESMTIDEMRGRLLRTEPPNERMKMGTAFHSILEDPPEIIETIEKDGYIFKIECDAEIILPQIREIRASKVYLINGVLVTLTGGTDGITGNKISDHKLTFKENPETYFESYQWRAYLDIYNADRFDYIIYTAKQNGNEITIKNISTLPMYRYPRMENDLRQGIRDLLEFAKEHVPELIIKPKMKLNPN